MIMPREREREMVPVQAAAEHDLRAPCLDARNVVQFSVFHCVPVNNIQWPHAEGILQRGTTKRQKCLLTTSLGRQNAEKQSAKSHKICINFVVIESGLGEPKANVQQISIRGQNGTAFWI